MLIELLSSLEHAFSLASHFIACSMKHSQNMGVTVYNQCLLLLVLGAIGVQAACRSMQMQSPDRLPLSLGFSMI